MSEEDSVSIVPEEEVYRRIEELVDPEKWQKGNRSCYLLISAFRL